MSESSDKGKDFERLCRREAQRKLIGDSKRDRRSGAGELYKSDIVIPPVAEIAFNVECKAHERLNIPSWWEQTLRGIRFNKRPLLLFDMGQPMAVLLYDDLLNILRIVQDDTNTITELRS